MVFCHTLNIGMGYTMGTGVATAQKIVQIHQKNLGMGQTPHPPPLGGAKIAAVVLHTMNIEGQIHQKNPGMGQTPPFLAMPGFWTLWLLQSLP